MPFGFVTQRANTSSVSDQTEALEKLAALARRSIAKPLVKTTARLIVGKCPPRNDACELEAIFHAVHWWSGGDPSVPGLRFGVRYVHDPKLFDSFTSPERLLEEGIEANKVGRAPGEDCDGQAALIAALSGAVGFSSGLRAWGPKGKEFVHVFAIVGLPKNNPTQWVAMDATVDRAYAGWEPPPGITLDKIVSDWKVPA